MKKLRLLPVFLCILAVGMVSCDSVNFGDINEDDDAPQEANVEGLMAGGMNQFFTLAGRSYFNNPTLYVQYQTQSVYTTEMTYGENPYPWEAYYSGALSNFKEIYEITSGDSVSATVEAFGAPENQAAVAEIMSAVVFKRITDTWGPAPYRSADGSLGEALAAENDKAPAYTSQEEIYRDLISRVKAARDQISVDAPGPSGDILYGGDMENWQRFANSLILQMSLQISDAVPGYAQQEFTAALNHSAGVIEELEQEAWYNYQNSPGAINPLSQNRGSDYFLAEPFTDALQAATPNDSAIVYSNDSMVDERINVLSSDPSASGGQYGIAKISQPSGTPSISSTIWGAANDLPYMTAAYTYLNRAEAAQKGWTGESVEEMLTEGIMMSYATFDGHYDPGNENDAAGGTAESSPQPDFDSGELQSDGSDFAAQRIVDANTNAAGGYEQVIAEEKWVALFPMGFDAWAEWRRTVGKASWSDGATGYPGLYPAPDATNGGIIPRRYIYPSTEGGVNTANYEEGVSMLTPAEDNNSSQFWWEL